MCHKTHFVSSERENNSPGSLSDRFLMFDPKMTILVSVDPGYDWFKAQASMFTTGANGKGYK